MLLALGIPAEAAEADAEGIEHHVSEATLKAFAQFLASRGQS
jgi:DtxR family manganese transport transcriptional regulator